MPNNVIRECEPHGFPLSKQRMSGDHFFFVLRSGVVMVLVVLVFVISRLFRKLRHGVLRWGLVWQLISCFVCELKSIS